MDTEVGTLVARLRADTSDFSKGLGDAETQTKRFGASMSDIGDKVGNIGQKMTMGVTVPVVAGFALAVKSASDFNESLNKSNVIFGANAGAISKWAAGSARDFGLSSRAALDNAASFGNMFSQLGIGADTATKMSQKMVELAADFASFHNADITEVLIAQQAAFRGEYDAVQRFVPAINAAAVEQKALAMTGKESADALTQGEKAAAAYALMVEGAGAATGDFDRTSGGLANQMRIARAELENSAASIGQILIPALTSVVGIAADVASFFAGLPEPAQKVIVAFAGIAAAAGPIIWITGSMIRNFAEVKNASSGLTDALKISGTAFAAWAAAAVAAIGIYLGVKHALDDTSASYNFTTQQVTGMTNAQMRDAAAVILAMDGYKGLAEKVQELAKTNATSAREWVASADITTSAKDRLIKIIEKEEAAAKRSADAADRDAKAHLGAADAADQQKASLEDLTNYIDSQTDSALKLEGAQISMESAINNATETIKQQGADTLEARQAVLQGKQSIEEYGQATFAAAQLAGSSTEDAKNRQIWALGQVAGSLEPGSPLRVWLDEYIGRLNAIPASKTTVVSLIGPSGGYEGYNPLGLPGFSKGGWVGGVGNGDTVPAMLTPGEFVLSKDMLAGHAPMPAMAGASGGNSYTISVQVAPGGSPADTGRAIVESIKEFERRAGSSWRN